MLTEAMKRSGWRPAPNEKVRDDWKARNGAWMVKTPSGPILADVAALMWKFEVLLEWPWRPVYTTTYDYAAEGWGAVMATHDGYWWCRWKGIRYPFVFLLCEISTGEFVVRRGTERLGMSDDPQFEWIAPCVKPEVLP